MPKRVLMFGWEFPPHNSGGLGVACYGITKALARKNIEVIFVLPRKLDGVKEDFLKIIDGNIECQSSYLFNSPLYPYVTDKKYYSDLFHHHEIYGNSLVEEVFRYAEFGKKIAKKEKFDVIHAHDWLSFGAGIKAKEVSGKPLVVHVHATEFDRCGGSGVNSLVYALEKEGMEKADKIIAVSNYTKNIIVNSYGIHPDKVEVVHNGVDFNKEYSLSENVHAIKRAGKKMVLFVGRLTLQKGPDYFIKVAKKICDVTEDIYFVISGSGDMQEFLISEVAQMKISDRVLFSGFLRGKDLQEVYALADLFVMPSVSEPFGITPLEAISSGTPVLISNQSGVSEVVSHALKADFWDIDDMANKVLAVLNYDPLSYCLKENGKKEIASITWEKAAEKCIQIYNNL
jgi:glycogen synthase